jgi:branched-chain amino acid transport system ATP-binding protein
LASEALKVIDVKKQFGALAAVGGVSLCVERGERRAVIGPNGAGKTTFFNLISGALPPTGGTIQLNGQDVTNLPDWKRVRLGLARTFQRNNLFLSLTTYENIRLAVQRQLGTSYNMLRALARHKQVNERVEQILEAVGLSERAQIVVANLSYGEQRQLEVALSLATDPKILLLDEPTAGMSASETNRMIDLIKKMPSDLTLVIVEHDMEVVFAIASRITVLHLGMILTEGTPQEVQGDPRVREVYLGEEEN